MVFSSQYNLFFPPLPFLSQLVEYLKLKPDGLIFYLKEACPNPNMPGEVTALKAIPWPHFPTHWSQFEQHQPELALPWC